MKGNSLTQLSVLVVVAYLASFIVSADQAPNPVVDNNLPLSTTSTSPTPEVENTTGRFTFSSIDLDQNGKLSEEEVARGKNNWLANAFIDIDANEDKSLTEQELIDFATKVAAESAS